MTNTPTPDQGEALTQAKTELTNLQSAYDAIRNLPPTEFTNHFARTIAEHQSHSRSNNDDGVPMLLVPLHVDTDTDTLTAVEQPQRYRAAEHGHKTTLDPETHTTIIDTHEACLYLDTRATAPTDRHFRSLVLLQLANQLNRTETHIKEAETTPEYPPITCDICGSSTSLGYVGLSWLSQDTPGWGVHFCANCETEIAELLSSFEPAQRPGYSASFTEIWNTQETCAFCKTPFDDTDTRAGIEVFAPDSDETEIDEELYCICSDCSPVLESFFENIGVSISPRTDS